MALKSKEWFYKECMREIDNNGPISALCKSTMDKGIGQSDSTRGHVTQAIGACQEFLGTYPQHIATIRSSNPTIPFDVPGHPPIQHDLQTWLSGKQGTYGRTAFGYSYDTLRNILPPTLGGTRQGGGGGGDEFKRVLRLMAEFI